MTFIILASIRVNLSCCNYDVRMVDLNLKTVAASAYILIIPNFQLLDRELLRFQVFDGEYIDSLITCQEDVVVGSHNPLD